MADQDRERELAQDLAQCGAERDELLGELTHLREENAELRENVKELERDLKEAQDGEYDALGRVEFLEGEITEPTDLMDAARELLRRLDSDLGPERWDESMPAYKVFRAMDDLRDALRKPSSPLADYARAHNLKYGDQHAHH